MSNLVDDEKPRAVVRSGGQIIGGSSDVLIQFLSEAVVLSLSGASSVLQRPLQRACV